MKAEDLRRMTDDELRREVTDRKREQLNLRFQRAQGETKNVAGIRKAKRDAARALTIIGERRMEAELDASDASLRVARRTSRSSEAEE